MSDLRSFMEKREPARVSTFHGEEAGVEGVLLHVSSSGLCKVRLDVDGEAITVARHRDRLRPLNDEAREMLK